MPCMYSRMEKAFCERLKKFKKVLTLPLRHDIISKNNKGYDEDGRVIPLSENRWLVQTDSVNFDKTYHFRAGVPKSNRLVDFSRVRCVNA